MALSLERRALFRVNVRLGGMETALCGAGGRSAIVPLPGIFPAAARRVFWHNTRLSRTTDTTTHTLFIVRFIGMFIGLDTLHRPDRRSERM